MQFTSVDGLEQISRWDLDRAYVCFAVLLYDPQEVARRHEEIGTRPLSSPESQFQPFPLFFDLKTQST